MKATATRMAIVLDASLATGVQGKEGSVSLPNLKGSTFPVKGITDQEVVLEGGSNVHITLPREAVQLL